MKIKSPITRYYGGKWNMSKWIISHFPEHSFYCEPFLGMGSVFLRKTRSKHECLNDINGQVTTLFKVLRDKPEELVRVLSLTPWSRIEYINSLSRDVNDTDVEIARKLVVRYNSGIGKAKFISNFKLTTSPNGNFKTRHLKNYGKNLYSIAERLQGVVIESLDYRVILKKYDRPHSLFYIDPPYIGQQRNHKKVYDFDMREEDHVELIETVLSLQGKVIISAYDHPLYKQLIENGWVVKSRLNNTCAGSKHTELLYINPAAADKKQMELQL